MEFKKMATGTSLNKRLMSRTKAVHVRYNSWYISLPSSVKALANEDTLLRTHCCRHKRFPVCPRAQHLLRTQIKHKFCVRDTKNVSATNISQFAQPKKHHGQHCVRNNVSSFTRALKQQREITEFCLVWRIWNTIDNFWNLHVKSFDKGKQTKWL